MEQHKITKYYSSPKNKDGKEYKTKDGKPFVRVAIQTDQLSEGVWASANAFNADDQILKLKQGDVVTLKIWQEGQWWNFKLPTRLDNLEERIESLEAALFSKEMKIEPKGAPNTDIESLPF